LAKIWRVVFEGEEPGPADDFELDFADLRDLIGDTLILKEEALEILKKRLKQYDHYNAIGNIKDVSIPPGEEIIPLKAFFALLGIDKQELRFGFLMFLEGGRVILVAVWPEPYAEAIKNEPNLIGGVISSMIDDPDNWRRVDVVLPLEGFE